MTELVLTGVLFMSAASMPPQTVSKSNSVTATATIVAIDQATRQITLRDENGAQETYQAGPAVARFDELKAGDKVRMTYYESVVFQLRKPGETSNPPGDEAALNRAKSTLPAGSLAAQERRTVTVKSVDPTVPSITVATEDGRTITRKIAEKKNLDGVNPGDRIDVTYTLALLVNIDRVK